MAKNNRVSKALNALEYLEEIIRVNEDRDFVEVIGGMGGDMYRYRVYFDNNDTITHICEK